MLLSPLRTQVTFREKAENGRSPTTPAGKTPVTPAEDQSHAGRTEDLSFWKRARDEFEKDLRKKGSHGKELTEFLGKTFTQEEAQETCRSLEAAGGSSNPAIAAILRHMDTFLSLGDLLTAGAPQSVGLAWWGVRVMAGSIQRGHKLANDIMDAMAELTGIMVRCRNTVQTWSLRSSKDSGLHSQLMTRISPLYRNILEYSFHAHRFFNKSSLLRLTSFDRFTGLMQSINRAESQMEKDTSSLFQREMLQQQQRQTQQVSQRKSHRQVMQEEFKDYEKQLDPLPLQDEILQQYSAKRHPDTLHWFFYDTMYYEDWWYIQRGVLWICGKEGSGKSTLAAAVVERMKETDAHIYYDYVFCGDDRAKTADRILATLIYRLSTRTQQNLDLLDRCNDVLRSLMEKRPSGTSQAQRQRASFPTHELINVFVKLLNNVFEVSCFIILDGIDALENNERKQLSNALTRVMMDGSASVKILVTARHERNIPRDLSVPITRLAVDEMDWTFGEPPVRWDIRKCALTRLESECDLDYLDAETAANAIADKAGDCFSYVDKAIDFLSKPFAPPLQNRLDELPDNLENAYAQALSNVDTHYADLLKTVLKWTLLSQDPNGDVPLSVVRDDFYRTFAGSTDLYKIYGKSDEEKENAETKFASQLRNVASAFLTIDTTFPRHVRLQGPSVKRYFFDQSNFVDSHCEAEKVYCSRCRAHLSQNISYYFDEKLVALEFAITLLETLNSPVYHDLYFVPLDELAASTQVTDPTTATPKDNLDAGTEQSKEQANGTTTVGKPDCANPDAKLKDEQLQVAPAVDTVSSSDQDTGAFAQNAEAVPDYDMDDEQSDSDRGSELDFLDRIDDDEYDPRRPYLTTPAEDERCREELRYESTMWPSHLQELERLWSNEERTGERWDRLRALTQQFLSRDTSVFQRWATTLWRIFDEGDSPEPAKEVTALFVAVAYDIPWLVRNVVDEGVSPSALHGPWNALHLAIDRRASLEVHRMLISHVDVNAEPDHEMGVAPFDALLASDPDPELVKLYLQHGADCKKAYRDGNFAIHTFAKYGSQIEVFHLLLEDNNDINIGNTKNGRTPLHYLLDREICPPDLFKEFLEGKAQINAEDSRSVMPLRAVAKSGNLEAMKTLIEREADINDKDDKGRAAIHDAAMHGRVYTVSLLIEKGAPMNDQTTDKGWTPLMYACRCREERAAVFLIEKMKETGGYDINCSDAKGKTPLRKAAAHGMPAVVEALLPLSSQDDINQVDTVRRRSALHVASRNGHRNTVELLLNHGADATLRDSHGKTALDLCYAAWFLEANMDFDETLEILIRKSPAEASENLELVGDVAAKGSEALAKALLDAGADFYKKNQHGWHPLLHAIQNGHDGVCDLVMLKRQSEVTIPSRLSSALAFVSLSEDGLEATCDIPKSTRDSKVECATVVGNSPVPLFFTERGTFYFEAEIIATNRHDDGNDDDASVFYAAIGICAKPRKLADWALGVYQRGVPSWAYLESGDVVSENDDLELGGVPYRVGDVVGCGFTSVDRYWNSIFWTRNGTLIESIANIKGCLYPAVHMFKQTKVVMNFGGDLEAKPFVFKKANRPDFTSRGYERQELEGTPQPTPSRSPSPTSGRPLSP